MLGGGGGGRGGGVAIVAHFTTGHEVRARVGRPQIVKAPPPPTPPVISLLAVPRRLFCFGSLVILDVMVILVIYKYKNR